MLNRKSFTSVNGQLFGSALINDWKYVTSDDNAALSSSDYFKDVQPLLNVGDLIHVYYVSKDKNGNDTSFVTNSEVFIVRMSDAIGNHIAVLPKHDLNGQGELINSNVGDTTTIVMSEDYTVTEAYCILSGFIESDGDGATITVKNGAVTIFSTTIDNTTGNGSVIKMTKNETAAADSFIAESFEVSTDGGVDNANGTITVVLHANET